MFKAGDRVRILTDDDTGNFIGKTVGEIGSIRTILTTSDKKSFLYVKLDNIGNNSVLYGINQVELLTESSELEELVKKANAGYKAIDKLRKYSNNIEIKSDANDWVVLSPEDITYLARENSVLRIKTQTRKFKVADWNAEINKNEIKIGCRYFIVSDLKTDLDSLLNKNQSAGCNYPIYAQRNGLLYNSSVAFTWQQAEDLLKELEK